MPWFWGIFLNSLICFKESRTLSMFSSAGSSALTSMWSSPSFVFIFCKSWCISRRMMGCVHGVPLNQRFEHACVVLTVESETTLKMYLLKKWEQGGRSFQVWLRSFNQVYVWTAWGRWYESYDGSPLGAGRLSIIDHQIHSIYFYSVAVCSVCTLLVLGSMDQSFLATWYTADKTDMTVAGSRWAAL